MKKIFLAFFVQITSIIGFSQSKILVHLKIMDTLVSCEKNNFSIHFEIKNNSQRKLKIPDPVITSINDYAGDMICSIEKYNEDSKKFLFYQYIIPEMAIREIKFSFILPNNFFSDSIQLPCLFTKNELGFYRLRLKLCARKFNKGMQDYYSNWISFRVVEPYSIN